MARILNLILFLLLSGNAAAQSQQEEDIFIYMAKDGHARGKDGAPVTLIEFSDFQCSFCRKFWKETLPLIEKRYIKAEKVRFVYRHLVILGRDSMAAAQAVECAGEQGKFWGYHDALFTNQGPLAFTPTRLKAYAKELGLKGQELNRCLDSGKYLKKVESDTVVASFLGATGTPAFFLNGRLVAGAQPFEAFATAIEKELERASLSKRR